MLTFKKFTIIIVSLIFSACLNGCGATYSVPAPEVSEEPAPVPQVTLPDIETEPPAAIEEEQKIEESPQDDSQTSILKPTGSTGYAKVIVDYADIEFVQHRLIVYENKFEQWLEISEIAFKGSLAEEITSLETECMQKLETILSGYSRLMERMQQSETVSFGMIATIDPKEMQQLDIDFLESRCNDLLNMNIAEQYEPMPEAEPELSFAEAQEIIASHMLQGNYQDALLAYESLSLDFPDQAPSISTRFNYGRALQYTGQIEAAAKQFKSILESGDLSIESLVIQRNIADLFLASNNSAAAEFYYDSMIQGHQSIDAEKAWAQEQLDFLHSLDPESEEMIAYMKFLHEFQTYDYKIHAPRLNEMINAFAAEHEGSPIAASALRLKTFAMNQLKFWYGFQLVKINGLVAEKKFSEANAILKDLSRYYLPAELQPVLQKTFYDVAQAEVQEVQIQQRINEIEVTEQWNSAVNLLDSQQYDKAISAFESLIGTEYEKEAKIKEIEAANKAAAEMRKEAASLFIRAGKTPDLEQKKGLLLDSHRLLTEILIKYPQSELLDKVQQNLTILEEQIERFDPTLLEEPRLENPAEFTADPYGTRSKQFQ
jgi:tetratricopeptide (TPR) repeat protein